jgi:hypothetical protein
VGALATVSADSARRLIVMRRIEHAANGDQGSSKSNDVESTGMSLPDFVKALREAKTASRHGTAGWLPARTSLFVC